jgi:alpha-1,3-mannosyltransferase
MNFEEASVPQISDIVSSVQLLTKPEAMQILHVVRQFWPATGGLENFVLELATEQVRNGIRPHVLTLNRIHSRPGAVLEPVDEVRGIGVRRIGYWGSRRYPVAPASVLGLRSYDIIHVHGVDFFCDYLAATSGLHGRPLVLSTHGGFFHTPRNRQLKQIFFNVITRRSVRRYGMVLASSINDEKIFRPIAGARLHRIDNGVDTTKLADAASNAFKPALIYFGRFSSNKGLSALIATFVSLKKLVPEVSLHLVGNDYDGVLPKIQAQISSTLITGSIHIHTEVDDAGLRNILNSCSVFVSASEYEGFGLTLVEGMSAGLIPIVSRIPSFEAIIKKAQIGIALDFTNQEQAACNIALYMERIKADYASMRLKSIGASQHYSWGQVAKKFHACYLEILGPEGSRMKGAGA